MGPVQDAVQGTAYAVRAVRRFVLLGAWVALLIVVASKLMVRAADHDRSITIQRMRLVEQALDRYAIDNGGAVPTTRQKLKSLWIRPTDGPLPLNWHGPYLPSEDLLRDGWGRPFQYVAPGGFEPTPRGVKPLSRTYDLWSLGADGREGGTGANASIRSWEAQSMVP